MGGRMGMMKIRVSVLLAVAAAAAAGTALFGIAQKVQTAEKEFRTLRAAAAGERETIRVLNAEWDYLNRPDRLESLARDHLSMILPQAGQMAGAADALPEPPPLPESFMKAGPAVMTPVRAAPVPRVKPVRREDPRGFQSLLDVLSTNGGAR